MESGESSGEFSRISLILHPGYLSVRITAMCRVGLSRWEWRLSLESVRLLHAESKSLEHFRISLAYSGVGEVMRAFVGGEDSGDVGAVLFAGLRCFFEDDPMAAGELVDRTQREELAPPRDQPLPHFGESEVGRLLYGAQQQVGLRLDTAGEPDTQCHNYQ